VKGLQIFPTVFICTLDTNNYITENIFYMTQQQQQGPTPEQRKEMAIAKRDVIHNALAKAAPKIQALLPRGMVVKKLLQIVLNSCTKNPKLLECTPLTILGAVMQSAELGLIPDGITGEAHILPFWNGKKGRYEAQFIPGYKGLIKLAYNSGQVKRFQARVVYDQDEFSYEMGLHEKLSHKRTGKTSKPTHFYVVLEFANGGIIFDVATTSQIEQVRNDSPNYKKAKDKTKTIWFKHFDEMGMKTMIRRLAKYAPLSAEFQRAVALDEQFEELGNSQSLDLHLTEYDLLPEGEKNNVVGDTALSNEEGVDGEQGEPGEDQGEPGGEQGAGAGGAANGKTGDGKTRADKALQQTLNMMEGKK
jgi:recombination protein RecT